MKKYLLSVALICLVQILSAQTIVDLIDCDPDCIWTTESGNIKSWNFDEIIPAYQNISAIDAAANLSIGHVFLNSDTTLHTFISHRTSDDKITYWDGGNWNALDATIIEPVIGIGSHENHTYIKVAGGIYYYDGLNEPMKISENTGVGADLTVDELGRAWLGNSMGPNMDSILVLSPLGEVLFSFPLSEPFPSLNFYGMAMVDDTIYIGLGANNPNYPEKVLTVIIEDDVALITNKIHDFAGSGLVFADLASARPGNPLSIPSSTSNLPHGDIQIYPNPANDVLIIDQVEPKNITIYLYNMQGILLKAIPSTNQQTRININDWPAGMYLVMIKNASNILSLEKLIKTIN